MANDSNDSAVKLDPSADKDGIPPQKLTLGLENKDRLVIIGLCLLLLIAVAVFFWFVDRLGLLSYPDGRLKEAIKSSTYDYFGQALEYRERRLSLALTFRTFVTSLGFTVGLVMATIGGIFVLGRARARLDASVSTGDGAPSIMQKAGANFTTNSPGIVFMLGGVAVIWVTQYYAIGIGAPEIFPANAKTVCPPDQVKSGTCWIDGAAQQDAVQTLKMIQGFQGYCSNLPGNANAEDKSFCEVLSELTNRDLEVTK